LGISSSVWPSFRGCYGGFAHMYNTSSAESNSPISPGMYFRYHFFMGNFRNRNCRPYNNVQFFSAPFFPVSITLTNSPGHLTAKRFFQNTCFPASIACWKMLGREFLGGVAKMTASHSAITFQKASNPKNCRSFGTAYPECGKFGRIPAEGY